MARTVTTSVAAALCLWLSACATPSAIDSPHAGQTAAYEPGVPNFDMESIVGMEGERSIVEVFYTFPVSSLVFVQANERYEAEYELVVRVLDRSTEALMSEQTETDSLSVSAYDSTLSFHSQTGRLVLDVPPGEYVLEAVLTDSESGESARRRQGIRVPSAENADPYVSRILLEGKRDAGIVEPVISMHLPARMDSLRASIQVYNLPERDALELSMSLVQFEVDTSVASPPYWLVPSRGSLAYRGIDYDAADTIQVTRRALRDASESTTVQFSLPRLERGLYGLTITGLDSSGTVVVGRERTISVKNPTFPQMTLLEDLVESLAYIAYDNEIESMEEGASSEERKRRFDAFWGALVSNRNVAANLIELYYSRIEEANLFFTGYKEGWMTDRGMIFTILGPPAYVDRRMDMERWHYSYGDRDPVKTFVFERVRHNRDDPFETYILQRRPYYQTEWSRAIDRWRDGKVL